MTDEPRKISHPAFAKRIEIDQQDVLIARAGQIRPLQRQDADVRPSVAEHGRQGVHVKGMSVDDGNLAWADHLLFALLRADYDALLRAPR